MRKIRLNVKTKSKIYPIIIGKNIITQIPNILKSNNINFEKSLIVVDSKIPKKKLNILKKKIVSKKTIILFLNASEKNKNLKSVNLILNKLFKFNFNRNDCIISFGGGIVGDISGFAASIFKRGLKFINIPTTLLSQVDSSIGGKTGVNNKYGKNLIGSFMQPDLVISDINMLNSIPKREIICGYGEILKHSIISDRKIFNYLKKNYLKILKLKSPFIEKTISDSCKIKRDIVQQDEKEKNLRKILNLGHTFAHAYEAALSYSKKLNHGEAVILGVVSSAKFSIKNNILNKKDYKQIINHINNLKIPVNLNFYFKKKDINLIIKYMKSDKKNNSSKINLILIKKIGKVILDLKYSQSKIKKFLINELIY
jgi:3-dehydroquinate synthase/shikimate kinase/3-dehydroquinate synthase